MVSANISNDREAEPGATRDSRAGSIHSVKALKDAVKRHGDALEFPKQAGANAGVGAKAWEAAFEAFPDARFNLEVKCANATAIRATLDLIERFDRADRTLLAAGEDDVMTLLRTALAVHPAEPAIGASLGEIVAAIGSALGQGPMPEGVDALQIPAEFGGQPLATPELVEHAHAHGVEVHVWTINDLDEIAELLGRRANKGAAAAPVDADAVRAARLRRFGGN